MVLAHFQLTHSELPRSVLRLVQITEYDYLRHHASSEDAVISRDLAKVRDAFPGRDAETAFAEIFGDASPGWDVQEGSGAAIVIETGPNGADFAALMAGCHTFESRDIFVRISPERWGKQGVAWRHPHWKTPGNALRKAPITVLRDIPAFAERLARELKLSAARQASLT